jgi:hypothetical protein
MTAPVANCPSCGAEVRFRWAGAVQTVCEHCSSILVRHDVDLERVGRVSEPPPVTSRIRVGTEGTYEGRAFTVVGRIAYAWESGAWSEWHLAFGDGRSGWLSDAQDEYAVTFAVPKTAGLPHPGDLRPGVEVPLSIPGGPFTVGAVTLARYAGVEGELPFAYHDKTETPFVDLRSQSGGLATLDYSERPPLLFAGAFVELASLGLRYLLDAPQRRVEGTRTLNCPGCGGTVTLRRPGESVNAVCEYCLSVLEVGQSDRLQILQRFADRIRVQPLIPLGQTGRMHGAEWTVLGMQQRTIRVESVPYSWREYLLHNPERGFRYLTEYDGHWNDVIVLKSPPAANPDSTTSPISLHGVTFRPFQHATPETTFVLGEFPWRVKVGERAKTDDYVAPPRLLSREQTEDEVTWSLGEYTPGARVWEAFGLADPPPPRPRGTYANQPSPHGEHGRMWPAFTVFAVLLIIVLVVRAATGSQPVLERRGLRWETEAQPENVIVTEPFRLQGRTAPLRVGIQTGIVNGWAAFEMTLVDEATGRTREFVRELSYYAGFEDGERWTEGSRKGSVTVPAVPAGTYRLVIAPQGSAPMDYDVRVTRGGPAVWMYLLALLALLVPPALQAMQHLAFEHQRWMESDYPPVTSDDDEE